MKDKFFNLELSSVSSSGKIIYEIPELDEIYHHDTPIDGAIAILKSEKYPGHCQIFYVYRKSDEDGVITCTFTPATTKDGSRIFIKYNKDHIFCLFDRITLIYDGRVNRKFRNSKITIESEWGV